MTSYPDGTCHRSTSLGKGHCVTTYSFSASKDLSSQTRWMSILELTPQGIQGAYNILEIYIRNIKLKSR